MTAENIAKALGGRKAGAEWMARCPAHADRDPSLSICDASDGRVLVRCHAGCDQKRVIAVLRSRRLWEENGERRFTRPAPRVTGNDRPDRDDAKRTEAALAIWQSAVPADGTPVETYLRSRGLNKPPPSSLRFHAGLKHPTSGIWPAMVALVTRGTDGAPLAIHRTFMSGDGTSKAPIEPAKMMLGPCRGGAVRLGPITDRLLVAEGIENALSAMQATGHAAWAALSTSGLRTLELPVEARDVVVLADGDEPGEAAARDCAWRWKRESRRVRIARPPQEMDFNDFLMDRADRIEDGAL
jgi:putative DNA primase/helicase